MRNVTSNSFQVKIQDWDYLDPSHPGDNVSYLVMEGSITSESQYFCSENYVELIPEVNLFATDNCDGQLAFEITDSTTYGPAGKQISRRWSAVDDCGNSTDIERTDTCGLAALKLKVIVFGSTLGTYGASLMRDDLRSQQLIPLEEPYGSDGEETTEQAIFDRTGSDAIVDWVLVEIRKASSPDTILATRSALMERGWRCDHCQWRFRSLFPQFK